MRKFIIISLLIILGFVLYDTFHTPDYVKVNQEMTNLCTYSNVDYCD